MTGIGDKAEESKERFTSVDALGVGSIWCIESSDLQPADDLGSEEFPRYGDWLKTSSGPDSEVVEWVECPGGLARAIVDELEERGVDADRADEYWLRVDSYERADDDENAPWHFDVTLSSQGVEPLEEALEELRTSPADE